MRLSSAISWYCDGRGAWELRIGDRVYGHLIMGMHSWRLFRPRQVPLIFRTMTAFNRWADRQYTTGLLERAA